MDYNITKQMPFAVNTPEDARKALELMEKIIEPLSDEAFHRRLSYSFDFRVGNINCSGTDKNEFIREIFGQTDFWLGRIHLTVSPEDGFGSVASLLLTRSEPWDLVIYSGSKDVLLDLECSYNIAVNEITNPPSKTVAIGTYIDQSQHVSIGGDANNAVIGNNNTVANSEEKGSFWQPILQSLIANWIWYVLGAVGVAIASIAAYLVKLKQG